MAGDVASHCTPILSCAGIAKAFDAIGVGKVSAGAQAGRPLIPKYVSSFDKCNRRMLVEVHLESMVNYSSLV